MARYIDLDKAKDEMKFGEGDFILYQGKTYVDISIIEKAILNAPTADVVPKSEVEKLKNENLILKQKRLTLFDRLEFVENAKSEVAREIFEEIEKHRDNIHGIVLLFPEELNELKKKYVEETK